MKEFYVYILASKKEEVLYIGITSDLIKRIYEHKNKFTKGFTEKYFVRKLVYYETHENSEAAIMREKQIKKWNRDWKIRIIEKLNPNWEDLYEKVI